LGGGRQGNPTQGRRNSLFMYYGKGNHCIVQARKRIERNSKYGKGTSSKIEKTDLNTFS